MWILHDDDGKASEKPDDKPSKEFLERLAILKFKAAERERKRQADKEDRDKKFDAEWAMYWNDQELKKQALKVAQDKIDLKKAAQLNEDKRLELAKNKLEERKNKPIIDAHLKEDKQAAKQAEKEEAKKAEEAEHQSYLELLNRCGLHQISNFTKEASIVDSSTGDIIIIPAKNVKRIYKDLFCTSKDSQSEPEDPQLHAALTTDTIDENELEYDENGKQIVRDEDGNRIN